MEDMQHLCSSASQINPPGVLISVNESAPQPQAEVKPAQEDAGAAQNVTEERGILTSMHGDLEEEIKKLKESLKMKDQCLMDKCLEIERMEALQMIPKKVENSKDLDLCFQAIQELERKIVEYKVHSLLPDVLKILVEQDIDTEHSKGHNWVTHWSLLRNCRLVCRSWTSSVDRWLELQPFQVVSSPYYLLSGFPRRYFPLSSKKITNYSSREVEMFKSFVQSFISIQENDFSYNPLPCRQLVIDVGLALDSKEDFDENTDKLSDTLCQYMQAFGHQLWYFNIKVNYKKEFRQDLKTVRKNLYRIYQCICKWLRLLPNLKSLAIDIPLNTFWIDGEIESRTAHLPFHHMEHLETFQCNYFNNFVSNLLKNNRHIQKFLVDHMETLCLFYQTGIMFSSLPNPLECSFGVRNNGNVFNDTLGIWELEKLTLVFCGRDKQKLNINRIIGTVTRPSKLEHLTLDFVSIDANLEVQVLELPSLKDLIIRLRKYEVIDWYKLLRRTASLETITVDFYCFDNDECEVLKTGEANEAFLENMVLLNAAAYWHFLPQLKSVSITTYQKRVKYRRQVNILDRHPMSKLKLSILFKTYS